MPRFEATSNPLAGNATYTSGTLIADTYDTIVGLVYASHAGTLYIEQSIDGTNWDLSESVAVSATTGTRFEKTIVAPYYRIKYTNGGTQQTTFRLSVKAVAAGTR